MVLALIGVLMKKFQLPLVSMQKKWAVTCLGVLLFLLPYTLLGNFHIVEPRYLPLTFIDQMTSFLPWTFVIYASDYIFIFFVIWKLKDEQSLSLACYASLLTLSLTFLIFLLFPTTYPRPNLPESALWAAIFSAFYMIDAPTNCLPSLHVSLTVLGAWLLSDFRGWKRMAIYLWALAICYSTLTTKQHYAVDILGGLAVAFFSIFCCRKISFARQERESSLTIDVTKEREKRAS